MKWLHTTLLVLGAALFVLLVAKIGPEKLWSDARSLGWALVPIVALSGVEHFLHMLAWRRCFHREPRPEMGRLYAAHLASNAISFVTPTATVGGEVARATLMPAEMPRSVAVAALTVDRLTWSLADAILAVIGVAVILARTTMAPAAKIALVGAVSALVIGILGFLWMQRGGKLVSFFTENRIVKKLGGPRLAEKLARGGGAVDREIELYHRERTSDLWVSVALHVAAISIACVQLAIFLAATGRPVVWSDVVAVFAAAVAMDIASFFVPARLGAQEAARTFATSMVGWGAEIGLAFALVVRLEQMVWVAIGLLAYGGLAQGGARAEDPAP
jgi:hypothetical protein